ncbi:carboxymuconolactone decarboxylase family protein [Aliiroseovarius sediminis]|uniref:carboxymuconolactone decarboxylase family protein n=1 Tax=Aliiroseovarius sediminis TaxID=2925839 RepID=UPI001F57CD48|nr:carboxymuconolactone decarboxylase family protein [Aliiroseovarius sediminis]MCI2395544.1 carboxymuconolactone decarboxylase family protein [Aliiroseovarius sediminis]
MDWKAFLADIEVGTNHLANGIPATMKGFAQMGAAAKTDGALSEKTKEFIALGIAISTRCDSCIGFHVRSLVRLGATRDEMNEALAMASYMGGGPSIAYSAKAREAFDQFSAG